MAREFAKAFYNSKSWKKARAAYIAQRKAIDGGMCESCHQRPGYIVHHKIELSPENINNPDIALNYANFKYDCHACHNKEKKEPDAVEGLVRYEFDAAGQPIAQAPPEMNRQGQGARPNSAYTLNTQLARVGGVV